MKVRVNIERNFIERGKEHVNVRFTDNNRRTAASVSNLSMKNFIDSEYSRISILEGASLFFIHSESTRHKDDILQSDKMTS